MTTRTKPKVGQTLYSLNIGNAARRHPQVLTPVTVTKVGRKYFTCVKEGWTRGTQYRLENWAEHTEYCANSLLYADPREWEDAKEKGDLLRKFKEIFGGYANPKLTLEQLRAVNKIVDKN